MTDEETQTPESRRRLTPREQALARTASKIVKQNSPAVTRMAEQMQKTMLPSVAKVAEKTMNDPAMAATLKSFREGAASKLVASAGFRKQMDSIAALADRQESLSARLTREIYAAERPELVDVQPRQPLVSPILGLLKDLLSVTQEQTTQIAALVKSGAEALAEDRNRAIQDAIDRRKMYRVTVTSVALAAIFGIITIIVALTA